MATSEAFYACDPSSPIIPTPTLASWIILTSFYPSPIAKTFFPLDYNNQTISTFWAGDVLQNRTHL